jgi:hypothetical protein
MLEEIADELVQEAEKMDAEEAEGGTDGATSG